MRPHAFLFDGDHPDISASCGDWMPHQLLNAVLAHAYESSFDVRIGGVLIEQFSQRLTAAARGMTGRFKSSSRTLSDDKELRKTLAVNFCQSATAIWSRVDMLQLAGDLLRKSVECITVSEIDTDAREAIHTALSHPGYLGCFEVDTGNPFLLKLVVEFLPHYYTYNHGVLTVITDFEGDGASAEWASSLKFLGIKKTQLDPLPIAMTKLSKPGEESLKILRVRGAPQHSEKVLSALIEEWEAHDTSWASQTVTFGAPERGIPAIDARKLTEYVLNDDHHDGKHKARLFRELLAINRKDWRFLAAQLAAGLNEELVKRARKTEYGVQYHLDIPVMGCNGKRLLVRTAWIIRPGEPPKLSTALIPKNADTSRKNPAEHMIVPPGIARMDWRKLYDKAHEIALEAARACVPTPMFISVNPFLKTDPSEHDYVEAEGQCGTAWVKLADGRSSFSRWLVKNDLAHAGYRGGVCIFSRHLSQSVARARDYCTAFADVLRINGLDCEVESQLT